MVPGDSVKVPLMPWEIDRVREVGQARRLANAEKADATYYRDDMPDNDALLADMAGAAAELVVAKYLNVYWSGAAWDSEMHDLMSGGADLEPNIEVRRVKDPSYRLIIRRRDAYAERNMFSVYVPNNLLVGEILGWIDATEGWNVGQAPPWKSDGSMVLVDREHLKHPSTFPLDVPRGPVGGAL